MSIIIGIDPGASGAIVMLENGNPIEWMHMPTYKTGSITRVNGSEIANFFSDKNDDISHVFIEQVWAMPGQGVSSMFNFGHSCGTVMGVISALNYPHTLISPVFWKNKIGIIGKGKDGSRARAIQLWPEWRDLDKKSKGQALADAALIALVGSKME